MPLPLTVATPERLTHHEYGVEPFTASELNAITVYEVASAGLPDTFDSLDADNTPEGFTAEEVKAMYAGLFDDLARWYEALDSLKSGLRNPHDGPAHSRAAYSYLREECIAWYRTLHLVRREACRFAFGTAGPRPEVDSGHLTFLDIPGIELDGRIAAESR